MNNDPKGPKLIDGFEEKTIRRYREDGSSYLETIWNEYECPNCVDGLFPHRVVEVSHEDTDRNSSWGEGIPTTRMECTVCGRWTGPWVSTGIVGDGW